MKPEDIDMTPEMRHEVGKLLFGSYGDQLMAVIEDVDRRRDYWRSHQGDPEAKALFIRALQSQQVLEELADIEALSRLREIDPASAESFLLSRPKWNAEPESS